MNFTNRLILLIIMNIVTMAIDAQDYISVPSKIANGPVHPLMEKLEYVRLECDSIVYKEFNGEGEVTGGGMKFIKSDVSELVDTVYTYYGLIYKDIYTYDTDHKLLMVQSCYGPINSASHFKYDNRGRVISIAVFSEIAPLDTGRVTYITYWDDQTIYTDSGYIHTVIKEIKIESEIIKVDTSATEYVFDNQDRLVRAGNIRYYYLPDGGLKIVTCGMGGIRKTEVISDNERLNSKTISYALVNGKWKILEYEESHSFKDGVPLAIAPVVVDMQLVAYGTRGGIILPTEADRQPVRVYDFSGRLVKRVNTVSDWFISLPRGMYVVVSGNCSCKVVVR